MQIELLYFAWVRSRIGRARESLTLEQAAPSVAEIIALLKARGGGYQSAFADPALIKAAVNQEYVAPDRILADRDELAFFPPVTGG